MKRRLLASYRLMLNFYGMHLLDEKTGEVVRNDQKVASFLEEEEKSAGGKSSEEERGEEEEEEGDDDVNADVRTTQGTKRKLRKRKKKSSKIHKATVNNWEERYSNLSLRGHNYLRITRIIKCLGDLGLGHLQVCK